MPNDPGNTIAFSGLRRLYDSQGCQLTGTQELELRCDFDGGIKAQVYMGPAPRFGISFVEAAERRAVPGQTSSLGKFHHHAVPTDSPYAGKFFTEIVVGRELPISLEQARDFGSASSQAREQLLAQAEVQGPELKDLADLIAGAIGLRFHFQFVVSLLCENPCVLVENTPAMQTHGSAIQILENISLNEAGRSILGQLLEALGRQHPEVLQKAGITLGWLLRAWDNPDSVGQFIDLFVPLENCLPPLDRRVDGEGSCATEIMNIISQYGGTRAKELRDFFEQSLKRDRPTLTDRFASLAQHHRLPGWEADIEAFRRFNRMRNRLVHQGDRRLQLRISITEKDVRTLADLVERYVCCALFGDARVYPSRFRQSM